MRSRSILLLSAFLLLITSLPAAATPAQSGAPEDAAFLTSIAPLQDGAGCSPLLDKLGISPLDSALNAVTPTCGACSVAVCRGASYNSFCGYQGAARKVCVSLLGDVCSQDNKPNCACYYGPLP